MCTFLALHGKTSRVKSCELEIRKSVVTRINAGTCCTMYRTNMGCCFIEQIKQNNNIKLLLLLLLPLLLQLWDHDSLFGVGTWYRLEFELRWSKIFFSSPHRPDQP